MINITEEEANKTLNYLKRAEWSYYESGPMSVPDSSCPSCHAYQHYDNGKHKNNCALYDLIVLFESKLG